MLARRLSAKLRCTERLRFELLIEPVAAEYPARGWWEGLGSNTLLTRSLDLPSTSRPGPALWRLRYPTRC